MELELGGSGFFSIDEDELSSDNNLSQIHFWLGFFMKCLEHHFKTTS